MNYADPQGLARCEVRSVYSIYTGDIGDPVNGVEVWRISDGQRVERTIHDTSFSGDWKQIAKDFEVAIGKELDHEDCELAEAAYLETYLKRYNSPLAAYALQIVRESDAQGLDARFIVALSGVESRYGTTQRANSWGQYNAFSNALHCATLTNPLCRKIDPYTNFGQAISGVTSMIGSSALYQGLNSVASIYSLYETGNPRKASARTPLLEQIYGGQLGGDIANVRKPRCPW